MKTFICFVIGIAVSTVYFWNNPNTIFKPIPVPYEVEAPVVPLSEALETASDKHKVPLKLLRAVAKIESNEDRTNSAVRREAHLVPKFGEANAKSYGVMQIMGFNAQRMCNVSSWAELVGRKNVQTNVECGAQILRRCLTDMRTKNPKARTYEHYRKALSCYNGDPTGRYADKVLLAYAELSLDTAI